MSPVTIQHGDRSLTAYAFGPREFLVQDPKCWRGLKKAGLLRRLRALGISAVCPSDRTYSDMDAAFRAIQKQGWVDGAVYIPDRPEDIISENGKVYLNTGAGRPNPFDDGSPKENQLCREWLSMVESTKTRSIFTSYWMKHQAEHTGGVHRGHISEKTFIEEAIKAGFAPEWVPPTRVSPIRACFNISEKSMLRASSPLLTPGGEK